MGAFSLIVVINLLNSVMAHILLILNKEFAKYPEVAKRASEKFRSSFLSCITDQSVIEIIEGLRDIQKISMEHFQLKRKELLHSHRKIELELEEKQNFVLRKRSIRHSGSVMTADSHMMKLMIILFEMLDFLKNDSCDR